MAHPVWPLFDLRVATPRLELRYIDDALGTELALLAARGIHDPAQMPFAMPWTDVASPDLERNAMQWYWRCRAETSPSNFHIDLAALVDGEVIGTTGLVATEFATLRQFETGSWLGRAHQGKGFGTEMRRATLQLGFAGLGATLAMTSAFDDNPASLGVTRTLGYAQAGTERKVRRGAAASSLRFEMTRAHWEQHVRRDDMRIEGLDACLPLLGL
ncbi:MAG: GNAT family N-acetyltransferase [Ilumatobacteraceae bacterium]